MRNIRLWLCALAALALVGCGQSTGVPASTAAAGNHKPAGQDGPLRADVKHGTDAGAGQIDMAPHDTTIDAMVSQGWPDGVKGNMSDPKFQHERIGQFEKTVWKVDATVKSIQLRKDGDYYLVVESPTGKQTVVEVPDPKNCVGSPMHDQIKATRDELEQKFHPNGTPKGVGQDATIQGVGFYGARGSAGKGQATGARLMPGLHFDWKHKS